MWYCTSPYEFGGMNYLWGFIPILLFIILLIAVFSILTKKQPRQSAALELLKVKLANGEITPDEYEHRKKVLTKK